MHPARDTLQHVIKAWWKVEWQEGGKTNTASFLFREWTRQQKHEASSKKERVIPEEKQQLAEEKDADNIRKVLCKSFIQWLWELNLCCYKYRVDCFGSLRLFFCCYWSEISRNITKHTMSGSSGNQLILFSLEFWCFSRLRLGKHQDSRENKTNCFPRDLTLSVYYYSFKTLAPIPRLIPHNPLALTIFGRLEQYTINLYSYTFTQLNRDCHWLILGHMALTKIKCIPILIYLSRIVPSSSCYPARDSLQHVIKAVVESSVVEARGGLRIWKGWGCPSEILN